VNYDVDQVIDRRASDSVKWNHYGDALPLWVADMDFVSPEPVVRALRERVEHGVFGYGAEPKELREVIATWARRRYHWQIAPDSLVFLPGVVNGFNLACRALTVPGDGVLIHTPVYPPINVAHQNAQLERQGVELTRQPEGGYTLDFDAFEAAMTDRSRIFVLCNPHNPVGRVFRRDELERMAELCLRHKIVICSDEIHCDLIYRDHAHVPIASLAPEVAARTITLIAPSKTFNIAGLQCAVAIVPDKDLRKKFKDARAGLLPHEANLLGLAAALAAYRDGEEWLEQVVAYLQANRDMLSQFVREHLPGLRMGQPEGTYLAWLDCRGLSWPGQQDGVKPCEFLLQQARVALNDGETFGQGGAGFVRLNFGCPRSTLSEALARIKAALPH